MNILKHPLFNLPNLMTASNFLCGIGSIISCFAGRVDYALFLLFLAMIFDFLDGFLARLLSISNNLGKQLDTLADVVSFGVAPGIIMMFMIVAYIQGFQALFLTDLDAVSFIQYQSISWLNALFHDIPNDFDATIKFLPFCALMIPFFSLFRLAKFNIDERQTDKFIGIPTPLNTLFFMFFPLNFILNFENWTETFTSWYNFLFNPYFVSTVCLVFPVFLLAEIPLMAMKFKHFRWTGNQFRYIMLISSVISIPIFIVWSIPIIVLLYLSLSIIENSLSKNQKHEI
jgi:CDP-diacylglycerol--serine O-phosphatidyltransferase